MGIIRELLESLGVEIIPDNKECPEETSPKDAQPVAPPNPPEVRNLDILVYYNDKLLGRSTGNVDINNPIKIKLEK